MVYGSLLDWYVSDEPGLYVKAVSSFGSYRALKMLVCDLM
jgi:hypothetical protein